MGIGRTLIVGAAVLRGRRRGHAAPDPYPSTAPVRQERQQAQQSPQQQSAADAEKPTELGKDDWKQVVKRAWKETKDDNVPLLAAGVAFYAFLALFPALIAMVTLYGLVADPSTVQSQIESLSRTLPPETATLIADQMRSITSSSSGGLGIGLVVSLLGALFSASGGVQNMMKAINLAYDEKESRGAVKLRGTALLLTLGAVVFVVVAVGLVAVLPAALDSLGLGVVGTVAVFVGRWVGLVAFMAVALAVLYRYAPDRDNARFEWTAIGSGVATVLWIVGSAGFSLYVSNFGKYGKTYGVLAGVVVLLLWLYLTCYIVLFGAEVNAEAERQTTQDTTQGPARPLGERRAVAADTVAS
ncbi:MAG: Ribonuclease [Frankiales bacterium]|nr:Ribonuclease [Frankiales bacterium]